MLEWRQADSSPRLSLSRGAAECASPEEAVLSHDSGERSALSGVRRTPEGQPRLAVRSRRPRTRDGDRRIQTRCLSRLWRVAGRAAPEGTVLVTRPWRAMCGQRPEAVPAAGRARPEEPPASGARWAQLGLNQRPLACEASALPLSYAPSARGYLTRIGRRDRHGGRGSPEVVPNPTRRTRTTNPASPPRK